MLGVATSTRTRHPGRRRRARRHASRWRLAVRPSPTRRHAPQRRSRALSRAPGARWSSRSTRRTGFARPTEAVRPTGTARRGRRTTTCSYLRTTMSLFHRRAMSSSLRLQGRPADPTWSFHPPTRALRRVLGARSAPSSPASTRRAPPPVSPTATVPPSRLAGAAACARSRAQPARPVSSAASSVSRAADARRTPAVDRGSTATRACPGRGVGECASRTRRAPSAPVSARSARRTGNVRRGRSA
jgi:hypothetical protein